MGAGAVQGNPTLARNKDGTNLRAYARRSGVPDVRVNLIDELELTLDLMNPTLESCNIVVERNLENIPDTLG